jgi:hypothetical protein
MGADPDKSLSDEATFAAARGRRPAPEVSIGDERTLGDKLGDQDTLIDDIEVVDLEARYKVEGTLGQGGMGAVLLATDTRLDRKVAIKRILGEAAGNRMAVQRFLTEAKAIAALNHPNIVQIYDYGRAKDGPFLIMEYVDGGSLLDLCKHGAMDLDKAVDLVCQVCNGLGMAHEQGIVHRDIKPANILINKAGLPKLTDFGLAKAEANDHGMTMTGAVMGTPDFMPPEQRRAASEVDHRSDLWSLAATFYQAVTGRSPKIIRFDLLPAPLTKVLGKALEDEKDARYQSAAEFREAIRQVLRSSLSRATVPALDLAIGECSRCREPNDANRKFCRNEDCAAPLRVRCLATECGHDIPVWEKVCPECGAKQPELFAEGLARLTADQEEAQRNLTHYDFAAAAVTAEALGRIADTRFREFSEWGRAFAERVVQEKTAAEELRRTRYAEAKAHRQAFDYPAAIHTIESLPEQLRDGELETLLASLRAEFEESKSLVETIRGRIAARDLDDLLGLVSRAIELQGNRADLRKLSGQLREREEKIEARTSEAFDAAWELFQRGNAKEALEKVASIDARTTPHREAFRKDLRDAIAEEEKLVRLLSSAKADGVVTSDEVVLLANQLAICLRANPGQQRLNALQEQLVKRIEQRPHDFLRHGKSLALFIEQCGDRLPHLLKAVRDKEAAAAAERAARDKAAAAAERAARDKAAAAAERARLEALNVAGRQCPRCKKVVRNGFEFIDHLAECK